MTTLMLSRLKWEVDQAQWSDSDLRGDDKFSFSYGDHKWRCGGYDKITHSIRTAGA